MSNIDGIDVLNLISRFKSGDDDAFSALVSTYTPLIKRIVRDMSFDTDEAFAEGCIGLYKAALSFDTQQTDVTFGLYARICIRRRVIDLLRKTRTAEERLTDFNVEELSVSDGTVASLLKREEIHNFRAQAKELLSEREYRVFLLWLGGDKTSDIARQLGLSAKSVENAKSRVMKKLRCGLKDVERS